MIHDLLLAASIVLLGTAWLSSFFDRAVRLLPTWRRVMSCLALVALTGSVIELLRSSVIMQQSANAHRLDLIAPFARTGLVLAGAALLTGWFSTWKTLACLLLSTLIVGLLWFFQLAATVG
jgi:hypothetical protein